MTMSGLKPKPTGAGVLATADDDQDDEATARQRLKTHHPGGWPRIRPYDTLRRRIREAWWVLKGSWSLHYAWQRGYDLGHADEYRRVVVNGGDLGHFFTALKEARGALYEMWPDARRDRFEDDPSVKAIDAVLSQYSAKGRARKVFPSALLQVLADGSH